VFLLILKAVRACGALMQLGRTLQGLFPHPVPVAGLRRPPGSRPARRL